MQRRITSFLLGFVASVGVLGTPTVARSEEVCPSGAVPYATGSSWTGYQCMDVYRPGGPGPHPAVVFVHGGAWRGGSFRSPTGWSRDAASLAARGYVTFNIEYDRASVGRKVGYVQEPADVIAAIRHVTDPASGYDVDPERVAVVGESAGGHLALLTAHRDPTLVTAVVAWSPPTDLAELTRHYGCSRAACADEPSPQWPGRATQLFLGACLADARLLATGWPTCPDARYAESSPVSWVRAASPPTLLANASDDPIVPFTQHRLFVDAAAAAGARVREVIVAGGVHGRGLREVESDPPGVWHAETVPFLDDCVKAPPCTRTGVGTATTTSYAASQF